VTNNSISPATTVRYTLPGSDPSSRDGQIYSGAFNLAQDRTVKAIAYGRGWLDSPIASVGYTVLPPLPFWRKLHSLAADGSQDLATPAGDGVANLLKYAFNLAPNAGDLTKSNYRILSANGTAGLPLITHDSQGRLVIEFVRRKASANSGITYSVETSGDYWTWAALDLTNAAITSIDNVWERVTVTDPNVTERRFGRVRVALD
jgi:hypothetical protein